MSAENSLRRRLGVRLAFGVSVMWLAAAVGSGMMIREELDEAYDAALQETAQRILPLAVFEIMQRDDDSASASQTVAALHQQDEFFTYVVRTATGEVLMRSHDADLKNFPPTPQEGFSVTDRHVIYGESAVSGSIFVEVTDSLAHRREATWESAGALALPLLLAAPLSLFWVWRLVDDAVRPVMALRGQIAARDAGDLSMVAAEDVPSELTPMVDAVNGLLRRLRRALEAERSFTANSAHELRTPIAASLAQTQRLISETPPGPLRDRARRIESSLRDLARLSEKLMQLAKAEGGALVAEKPSDLTLALEHVVDEFRKESGAGREIRLSAVNGAALRSRMDADAFAILMRNLIENARIHGDCDEAVEVTATDDNHVRVVNAGKVVPPDVLAGLTSRFQRAGSQAPGAGLGLSIAETIAAGAGGELTLRSPAEGRADGFEAELRLP